MSFIPKVLIIAGSDSGGGAGIQADIKTVTALGAYAMTSITAVTAQNTTGVYSVYSIKPKEITNLIKKQIDVEVGPSQIILKDDLNKIGLFKSEIRFHSEVKANISIKIDKIQSK